VLFAEPCAQVDKPASIAAKWPVHRGGGPLNPALAGGAFDDGCHAGRDLRAASQQKWHIDLDMNGAAGGVQPIQKPDGAAMLAGAHFRKQIDVRRQSHTHQLTGIFAVELQLEDAARRDLHFGFRILAGEPKRLDDAVA
jgi:hypothetical protein